MRPVKPTVEVRTACLRIHFQYRGERHKEPNQAADS